MRIVVLAMVAFLCHQLVMPTTALGQDNSGTDSLSLALATAREDTSKVILLNYLSANRGWRLGQYDTALYFANTAMALAEKLNYRKGIAAAHNNLGMTNMELGHYPEALSNHRTALQIRQEIGDQQGIAYSYNNIGMIHVDQGNYSEALKYYFNSLTIKREIGDKRGIANTVNNIGIVYDNLGNYPEALKNYFAALALREEINDKNGIAAAYTNIGMIYQRQGNYQEALENLRASLRIEEELGNKQGMADSYNSMGSIYYDQHDFTESLKNYFIGLKISEEIGDRRGAGLFHLNIGEVYKAQRNYLEALNEYFIALKIVEELEDKLVMAALYNSIGSLYVNMGRIQEGRTWLTKALSLSIQLGTKETIKESYRYLATTDSIRGDFRKAFEHYKHYILYRDSLFNEENTRKSVQTQLQYEFDKKEAATKAAMDVELSKQALVRNGLIGGFAALLIFSFILYSQRNKTLSEKRRSDRERQRSDELLLNILPAGVADELKTTGTSKAKAFTQVTVMFTDFKDFTAVSEKISAEMLVDEIHHCFSAFDAILQKYNIEKIKTIGDSYMCASGLPVSNYTHAVDMVTCALEIQQFILHRKTEKLARGETPFELRIGIHTGPVVAGIVGVKKYAYDIWGDTVNIAARIEQNSEAGKINISGTTYELVKHKFKCIHRGKIAAKNKGLIDMYYVEDAV